MPAPKTDPLWAQAAEYADAALAPDRAAINAAIQAAEDARLGQINATKGVIDAVGALSAGDAGFLRDTYMDAGRGVAANAGAFTGELARLQTEEAAKAQGYIDRIGAPGGPVESFAPANKNVQYYLGGKLPSESLFAEAPLAVRASLDKRLAAGLGLADLSSANAFQAQEGITGLRQKLVDLESKRPGAILEIWQGLHGVQAQDRQIANQERATQVQIGTLQLQTAKTAQETAVAYTNLTGTLHVVKNGKVVDTGRPAFGSDAVVQANENATSAANSKRTAANQLREKRLQEARDMTAATGEIHVVRNGRVVNTHRKTISQKHWEAEQAAAQKKADKDRAAANGKNGEGKVTTSDRSTALEKAETSAEVSIKTLIEGIQRGIPGTGKRGKDESEADYNARRRKANNIFQIRVRQQYPKFLERVIKAITPQLTNVGYGRGEIREYAAQILAARGIRGG